MIEITELLEQASGGDSEAANKLMPLIYDKLRAIAHRQLEQNLPQKTLATTELVNEAYLALFGNSNLTWRDRGHFFAYAARAMRSILTDRARRRLTNKRGGNAKNVNIDNIEISIDDDSEDLLALDQALIEMAVEHPRLAQVVELRYFAGLSMEDAAACLALDQRSVRRDWRKARAFINRSLGRMA